MPIACNTVLFIKVTTFSTNYQQLQIGPEYKYGVFQYQYSPITGNSSSLHFRTETGGRSKFVVLQIAKLTYVNSLAR